MTMIWCLRTIITSLTVYLLVLIPLLHCHQLQWLPCCFSNVPGMPHFRAFSPSVISAWNAFSQTPQLTPLSPLSLCSNVTLVTGTSLTPYLKLQPPLPLWIPYSSSRLYFSTENFLPSDIYSYIYHQKLECKVHEGTDFCVLSTFVSLTLKTVHST